MNCQQITTSIELYDLSNSILIQDESSKLVPFMYTKLLIDLYYFLEHRQNSYSEAADISAVIINNIAKSNNSAVINIKDLKATIARTLKNFDEISYLKFLTKNPEFI